MHSTPYQYMIYVLHVCLALYASVHALIYKKDSRAAFGWIGVCVFLPLLGPVLYFVFGVNRVHKRARALTQTNPNHRLFDQHLNIADKLVHHVPVSLLNLHKVSSHITGIPLIGGNNIECYFSCNQAYSAMLDAIRSAYKSIYLCVYIFKRDEIGKQFIQALIDARERGVEIYVLIDGIGQFYSWKKAHKQLARHNIAVHLFLPPKLIPFNLSINLRNHRKLLLIDDEICFLGGMNIAEEYLNNNEQDDHSLKDIHFKVDGCVTKQLGQIFKKDWKFAGGRIEEENVLIKNESTSPILMRAISDGPGEHMDHLSIVFLSAINSAKNTIVLMTPYFLPSRELIAALQIAALRGVSIIIILPERNNLFYVHWATRHMLWEVLEYGVHIYYQQGAFSHSKLFVVDDMYSLVGSANFDPRSLRLNYEVGLEIYDNKIATKLNHYAQTVLQTCRPVTLEEVDQRGLLSKIRDGIAWLFSPYL